MTAAVIAFFVVVGLGSVLIARRLVGLRTASVAKHEIEVDSLGVDELRELVRDLLDRTRDLGVGLSELDNDVQQLREVSYEQRLAARRAVQSTARRDADLQQDVAEIERRVRQLEADEGLIAARAFGGWLPRALPIGSGA
jgi:chromosome segregation ATPase